jgi:hypothetical protein
MKIEMTLAEIAKCADDEVVGSSMAIVDGIGPNVGLQPLPVTAGQYREQALLQARDAMWTFLLAGGSADALRTTVDEAISGVGNAAPHKG